MWCQTESFKKIIFAAYICCNLKILWSFSAYKFVDMDSNQRQAAAKVVTQLQGLDIDHLSPRQALDMLDLLQSTLDSDD